MEEKWQSRREGKQVVPHDEPCSPDASLEIYQDSMLKLMICELLTVSILQPASTRRRADLHWPCAMASSSGDAP